MPDDSREVWAKLNEMAARSTVDTAGADTGPGLEIETIAKRFSGDALVVIIFGTGIGLSLCGAGAIALLDRRWTPALVGFGLGLSAMAGAYTFPIWKRRVANWFRQSVVYLAAAGIFLGFVAGSIYVLGPYVLPHYPSANEIATAVVQALPKSGSSEIVPNAPNAEPNYVKNVQFEWDSQRPLSLLAFTSTSGEKLKVALQNYEFTPTPQGVFWQLYPSIILAEFGSLVEGQRVEIPIISFASSSTKDNEALVFGNPATDPANNNYKVNFGLHLVRVFFLMGSSSEPQNYKFAFIANRDPNNKVTVFWPHMLDDLEKWRRQ
jgi:hypothetical protein